MNGWSRNRQKGGLVSKYKKWNDEKWEEGWTRQWWRYCCSAEWREWELIELYSCFTDIIWYMMLWCNFTLPSSSFNSSDRWSEEIRAETFYVSNFTIKSSRLHSGFQIAPQHQSATRSGVRNFHDEGKWRHLLIWISLIFSNLEYTFATFPSRNRKSPTGSFVGAFALAGGGDTVRISRQH